LSRPRFFGDTAEVVPEEKAVVCEFPPASVIEGRCSQSDNVRVYSLSCGFAQFSSCVSQNTGKCITIPHRFSDPHLGQAASIPRPFHAYDG
jgi:hypothetical protein